MVGIRTIGIIGTPGCGKTTLCAKLGLPVIDLKELAATYDCLGKIESDGSAPIDVERLSELFTQPEELTLVDSHLAHHMPVDALVVLRCHPDELAKRLESRGYSAAKVQANLEVELMGGPWNELLEDPRPIHEGAAGVEEWIAAGCPHSSTPATATDWMD